MKVDLNKIPYLLLFIIIFLTPLSCSREAETVNPADVVSTVPTSPPGTTLVTANLISPLDGAADVDPDADIVISFSSIIDGDDSVQVNNISNNIEINGGAITYTHAGTDARTLTLDPNVTLSYSTNYTITIGTNLQANDGTYINQAYSWSFDTMPAEDDTGDGSTIAPEILNNSQYPSPGDTGVTRNLPYIEVTFSKAVNVFDDTDVTIASSGSDTPAFTVGNATNVSGNTWRITLSTQLVYGNTYTIDFQNSITDGSNNLDESNGEDNWNFTVENEAGAPAISDPSITESWVTGITRSSSDIYFVTDAMVDIGVVGEECFIEYGTSTGVYGVSVQELNWDGGDTEQIVHRYSLSSLDQGTTYYYRMFIDQNDDDAYTPGEPVSAEYSFTTGDAVVIAANNQDSIQTLQLANGSSYVFWEDNGDIYGQYYNDSGVPKWGTNGQAICTDVANQSDIRLVDLEGTNDVLVLYQDNTVPGTVYSKRVDTGGVFQRGGPVGSKGVAYANTVVSAGTTYSSTYLPGEDKVVVTYIDNATSEVHARIYDVTDTVNFGNETTMTTNQIIDTATTFTDVFCAPNSSVNGDFFVAYSDGSTITAKNIDVDFGPPDMLLVWEENDICDSNPNASFGWTTININQLEVSPNSAAFYILANNGTNLAIVKLSDAAADWSIVIANAQNPAILIDETGASENIILAYEHDNGGNYYIASKSIDGATGADVIAEYAVTNNGATYDCKYPAISLADTNTAAASAYFVSWFDGRPEAVNTYRIYTSSWDNTGTENWTSLVYETLTAAPATGYLKSVYYDNPSVGVIPIWIENNGDLDIYCEILDSTGGY